MLSLLSYSTMSKYLKIAKTFDEYDAKCRTILYLARTFVCKLKNRILEKKKKIKKFIQIIRYNKLLKNKPCNELDLYTLEGYNRNNKNIYLIDIELNKKWWFSIETITKLLCNNLSQFDIDTHNIICKTPVNPYINKFLNIGQLLSIYEQLRKYNNVNNLITLFRLVQFNISRFLFMYENDVIDYSYKYNIENIDNNGLLIILDNLLYVHNIYYVNVFKLHVDKSKRQSIINLLKNCLLSYKKNQLKKIRKFILNNTVIIRRAKRPTNTLNNNMMDCDTEDYNSETEDYNSETEEYNSETEIENNEININIIPVEDVNINNNSDEENKSNDSDEDTNSNESDKDNKSNNDSDIDTNSNESDEDNKYNNESDEDTNSNESDENNKSNNYDSDEDNNLNINDINEDNKSNNDDSDEDNKSNIVSDEDNKSNNDSDEDNKSNNDNSSVVDANKKEFNIDKVTVNIEMDIELENTFNNLIIN